MSILSDRLKIHDPIYIHIEKGGFQGVYSTRIMDMESNRITVYAPTKGQIFVPLETITIGFPKEGEGYYMWTAKMIEYRQEAQVPSVVLEVKSDKFKHVERRQYFRADGSGVLVDYKLLTKNSENNPVGTCRAKDISGGGVLLPNIKSDDEMRHGKMVWLKILSSSAQKPFEVTGTISRKDPIGKRHCNLVIEFQEIKPQERERLIHMIFEIDRVKRSNN